ncbi:MAG: hypothetical protein N2V75_11955 [Methanophagales archaeon]|nr:hypothetical protein [Methanophagales archaeon]
MRAKRATWEGEWKEAKGFWHQVQSNEGLKESLKKVKEARLIPEEEIRSCIQMQ